MGTALCAITIRFIHSFMCSVLHMNCTAVVNLSAGVVNDEYRLAQGVLSLARHLLSISDMHNIV